MTEITWREGEPLWVEHRGCAAYVLGAQDDVTETVRGMIDAFLEGDEDRVPLFMLIDIPAKAVYVIPWMELDARRPRTVS